MSNYVPYHIHSMLSNGVTNIDSITDFHDYVDAAKNLGMKAFGFSEHGSLFAWLKKKEYIESCGMKYIHAVEAYLTEDNEQTEKKTRDNYHIVLIARNYDGVKELNKLVSKSFCRADHHFYYMPRITFEELFATSDNIIITSACLGGVLFSGTPAAKEKFLCFLSRNPGRCFLEIQHHNCRDQIEYNQLLYGLHKESGISLIAGTDTHALNDEHLDGRAVLQKSKNVFFANEEEWDLTFKSYNQLLDAYKKQDALPMEVVEEAINNTNVMADMVEEFTLDYSPKYPRLYDDPEAVFKQKINEGVINRGIKKLPNYKEYVDRIHYEYDVYKHNGAIDFMLLEENYKSEIRKKGIKFGYSRGSVSGSIIAYLLGITEIDSVKYNLNFERFMNKERVSLADIDTDWFADDRAVVKDYLYGKEGLYCCDIVTFNTIALKGAVRDVCRALYKDEKYLDISREIISAAEADEESARKRYPDVFKYVDLVNGVVVSVGNHPAACVVSPFPVDEWFGTFTTSTDEYPVSLLNMKEIDSLNFVKLDILSLDNIGLICKTCDAAGIPFATPDNIPPDDLNVWKSIRDDTTMIFQWESQSAFRYLKQLLSDATIRKIRKGNENLSYMDLLSIGNGAIRPAGESYRDKLARGEYQDNGHKVLNDFLAPTLGYLVYQEQIIEFLHKFCGYTMGEADIVRRGFAKKTGTEKFIPKIKAGFTKTMEEKYGVSPEESDKLIVNFIKVIEDASAYLFSKNHADPYSWIGYICGYLRYYYPLEFITAALNIFEGKEEKSIAIINYAKKQGITISPIKFRHSIASYNFDKETNQIFKGISSVKYMNTAVAEEMYALKDNRYDSFMDLLFDLEDKTSLNSRQTGILIELDFFEEFGEAGCLLAQYDLYEKLYGKKQIKKEAIAELGVPETIIRKYADRETEKQYLDVNSRSLLREAALSVRSKPRSLSERIRSQTEYLGYINIKDARYSSMAAVLEVNTRYTPRVKLYALKNGTIIECKIDKKNFNKEKLREGDVIRIISTGYRPKVTKDAETNQWVKIPDAFDLWITSYKVIDNL